MSALLKLSIVVSVVLGVVDVLAGGPLFFRYEAVAINVVLGVLFGLTLRGERSIIQEFAERRGHATGEPVPINPDTVYYFRLMSVVWTMYFFAKAGAYAWIGFHDLGRALALRVVLNVTFYALLFTSIFLARPIIHALQRARLAPSTRERA